MIGNEVHDAQSAAEVGEPEMGPLEADMGGPEVASLLEKACSASLQAYPFSAQVKAAAARIGDHN